MMLRLSTRIPHCRASLIQNISYDSIYNSLFNQPATPTPGIMLNTTCSTNAALTDRALSLKQLSMTLPMADAGALACAESAGQAIGAKPFAKHIVRIAVQTDNDNMVAVRSAAGIELVQNTHVLPQVFTSPRRHLCDCGNVVVDNRQHRCPCMRRK